MADSSLPNHIVEDVGEARILEELARDIRRLLQDPMAEVAHALAQPVVQAAATVQDSKSRASEDEARQDTLGSNQPAQKTTKLCDMTEAGSKHSISKLCNQNGSNVEDRNSTPSRYCQEEEIGAILKSKSNGTMGSNQRPQVERELCNNSTKGIPSSILRTGKPKKFTRAEKEKWLVESTNAPPPPSPGKASKKAQANAQPESHGHQEASRKADASSLPLHAENQNRARRETWTEVKGPYWWRKEQQHSSSSEGASQRPVTLRGIKKFKHHARDGEEYVGDQEFFADQSDQQEFAEQDGSGYEEFPEDY